MIHPRHYKDPYYGKYGRCKRIVDTGERCQRKAMGNLGFCNQCLTKELED